MRVGQRKACSLTREADVSLCEVEILSDDGHQSSRGEGGKEAHHEVEPGEMERPQVRPSKGPNSDGCGLALRINRPAERVSW